jgi:hypothetical protein
MEPNDVFQRACLLQVSTSVWEGTKGIESEVIESLGQNSDWLKARKRLVNPELLGPIKTAVHQARNQVNKYSLPFPIASLHLVPRESLNQIDSALAGYRDRFWEKVQGIQVPLRRRP